MQGKLSVKYYRPNGQREAMLIVVKHAPSVERLFSISEKRRRAFVISFAGKNSR